MERLRKKVVAQGMKRFGETELKFDDLDSLASDASIFLDAPLPSAEQIAQSVKEVEVTNSDDNTNAEAKKSPASSSSSENNVDVGAAHVPLQVLDAFIAKFIHQLRVSYEESAVWIWQYLQTLLYLHLLGYVRKKNKAYPDVNWTSRTIQILLSDAKGSFEMFAKIMSPQRLTRLYYGLHNLLESIKNKSKFSDLPEEQQLKQFSWFIGEVKLVINNEVRMQQYLQIMADVARSYRSESVPIRRKLEKLTELNFFLGPSDKSMKLRRKIFEFFPLPLVPREPHMDSQFLAVGCSMKIITDIVPSMVRLLHDKSVHFSANAPPSENENGTVATGAEGSSSSSSGGIGVIGANTGAAGSSNSNSFDAMGNGMIHMPSSHNVLPGFTTANSFAGSSSSSGVKLPSKSSNSLRNSFNSQEEKTNRMQAFLGLIRQTKVPVFNGIRQFVADIMDLSLNASEHLSFIDRVRRIDRVVNALPPQRSDLRALVYNMFPLNISSDLINSLNPEYFSEDHGISPSAVKRVHSGEISINSAKEADVVSGTEGRPENTLRINGNVAVDVSMTSDTGTPVTPITPSGVAAILMQGTASIEDIIFATRVNQGLYGDQETVVTASAATTVSGSTGANGSRSSGSSSSSSSSSSAVVVNSVEGSGGGAVESVIRNGTEMSEATTESIEGSSKKRKSEETVASDDPEPRKKRVEETMDITFKEVSGHVMRFKVKTRIPLSRAVKVYCAHSHIDEDTVRFVVNKRALTGDEVISSLNLQSVGGVICVVPRDTRQPDYEEQDVTESNEGEMMNDV